MKPDPNRTVDSNDEPCRFKNFYRCPRCGFEWVDNWSSIVDDDCPKCDLRHITPYSTEDV